MTGESGGSVPSAAPRPPRSRGFWILWGIDVVVAAVVLFFFVWGLSDGSVSSFNIGLWLILLLGVGVVVVGGYQLNAHGRRALARALVLVLAVPALGYALFLLVVLIGHPRWN